MQVRETKAPASDTSEPTADTSEPNKKNGSGDTTAPTDIIPFEDAEREGKELFAKIKAAEGDIAGYQLRLGELAAKVKTIYGDRTLAELAKAIGINKTTLSHYRTVYRKWEDKLPPKDKLPPGAKMPSFTVLKALEAVEERAELIKAEPNMSKRRAEVHRVWKEHPKREEFRRKYPDLSCTRQAREIMHSYDAGGAGNGKGGNGKGSSDYKRWFNGLFKRCNEDMDETALADQPMDVEQLSNLLGATEPALLETMKECGEGWLKLYGLLSRLCEKGPEVVFEERERERRAKENAAKADQAKRERRANKAPTTQAAASAQVGA